MTRFADLHIHSYYSDGTMSPEEIVFEAIDRGIGLIAVCDHNMLEGSRELGRLCKNAGIGYVAGVEIDSLEGGIDYHILGYGADLGDSGFASFIRHNRELLDDISVKLIQKMEAAMQMPLYDYEEFDYDRRLGGWKCLHYLVYKGFSDTLGGALRYYEEYDCPFSIVDFPSIPEVCEQVRRAGGRTVLAHPGETIKSADTETFARELGRIVSMGLDGVECYYPTHSADITAECLKLCRKEGLIITAGSDCHGAFGKAHIGEIKVALEQLDLKELV